MVAVNARKSRVKTISDLIAKAKANPGSVSFGSSRRRTPRIAQEAIQIITVINLVSTGLGPA